jgi:hypothetical protein
VKGPIDDQLNGFGAVMLPTKFGVENQCPDPRVAVFEIALMKADRANHDSVVHDAEQEIALALDHAFQVFPLALDSDRLIEETEIVIRLGSKFPKHILRVLDPGGDEIRILALEKFSVHLGSPIKQENSCRIYKIKEHPSRNILANFFRAKESQPKHFSLEFFEKGWGRSDSVEFGFSPRFIL